jgi:hypothetical protein
VGVKGERGFGCLEPSSPFPAFPSLAPPLIDGWQWAGWIGLDSIRMVHSLCIIIMITGVGYGGLFMINRRKRQVIPHRGRRKLDLDIEQETLDEYISYA